MKIYRLKRRKARDLSKQRRRWREPYTGERGPGLTLLEFAKRRIKDDPVFKKRVSDALNKPSPLFCDASLSEHLIPTGSGVPEGFKRALAAARAAFRRLHDRSWLN